ncbi:MAG: hypothetical protein ACREOD_06205 [Candidatus Dormibacteria bacterium]
MATTNGSDMATLNGERADLEAREREIGVRRAGVKALIASDREPPEGASDLQSEAPACAGSCGPREAQAAPEGEAEAMGESGPRLAVG